MPPLAAIVVGTRKSKHRTAVTIVAGVLTANM